MNSFSIQSTLPPKITISPQPKNKGVLAVSLFVQSFVNYLLGQQAGMGTSVHSFSHLNIDLTALVCFWFELVSVNKILWLVAELQLHVFESIYWGVEVEILDVYCREFCAQSGHDAVEQKLDGEEVDCGGAAVAWLHNEVASNYEACLVQLLFSGL